jgi:hypothetical protein
MSSMHKYEWFFRVSVFHRPDPVLGVDAIPLLECCFLLAADTRSQTPALMQGR